MEVDRESKYLDQERKVTGRESVFCTPRLDLDWEEGTSRLVPWPVELVGQCLDQLTIFLPENLYFSGILFSNT